jgi:hypothetical protein
MITTDHLAVEQSTCIYDRSLKFRPSWRQFGRKLSRDTGRSTRFVVENCQRCSHSMMAASISHSEAPYNHCLPPLRCASYAYSLKAGALEMLSDAAWEDVKFSSPISTVLGACWSFFHTCTSTNAQTRVDLNHDFTNKHSQTYTVLLYIGQTS